MGIYAGITYNLKRHAITDPPDAEAEFDDAETIDAIKNALEESGCTVGLYEADTTLPARLAERRPDFVFNIAEGLRGRGREAQVPAILNFFNIPFSGSDETAMCITMDKAISKGLLSLHGIASPKSIIIKPGDIPPLDEKTDSAAPYLTSDPVSAGGLVYPVIVKPNAEGSGKGITGLSIADDAGGLRRILDETVRIYKQDLLVEEFIRGREFTVGILGNGDQTRIFTPMEIIFRDGGRREHSIYSYDIKRNFRDYVDYKCPPDIGAALTDVFIQTARKIYNILGCSDFARIDFRMDPEDRIYFIEINPLPGLAPGYSDYPMLAEYCGVGYNELIQEIMRSALSRYGCADGIFNRNGRHNE